MVFIAIMEFNVEKESNVEVKLIDVRDEEGKKLGFSEYVYLMDKDILDGLVKKGNAKSYSIGKNSLKVPKSVELEFASIIKNRVKKMGELLEGNLYIIDNKKLKGVR